MSGGRSDKPEVGREGEEVASEPGVRSRGPRFVPIPSESNRRIVEHGADSQAFERTSIAMASVGGLTIARYSAAISSGLREVTGR